MPSDRGAGSDSGGQDAASVDIPSAKSGGRDARNRVEFPTAVHALPLELLVLRLEVADFPLGGANRFEPRLKVPDLS